MGMAEDFDTVESRMKGALTEIAKETEKNGGGNILVVSHGMSILAMIADMTDQVPEGGQLENASVTKIIYDEGTFAVEELGNMSYVEDGVN